MSNKILINTSEGFVKLDTIFTEELVLFMRPYATPVQVTEAIRRASIYVLEFDFEENDYELPQTEEALHIILEYYLDDVLGHGESPAFTGN
jgi:hypothetical protein